MSYFISAPEGNQTLLSRDELAAHIEKKWSYTKIYHINKPESNHSLEWEIKADTFFLDGSLDKTQQSIHLYGDLEQCAAFAVWFRKLIPFTQRLLFYDEGFSADLEIKLETTEAQIYTMFVE